MRALLFIAIVYVTLQSGSGRRIFQLRHPRSSLREPRFKANEGNFSTEFFTQYLDHDNPNDNRTWQQRYYINSQYANGKKDVAFILIGGEQDASTYWMTGGAWIDTAKRHNAILFQLEHRYYGKSHPTPDLSTENLQYLTIQQALADLAHFIKSMNVKYKLSPKVKWIAFGGSYPGSLAAWLRQSYPDVIQGAVSASAPLLAKVDFSEMYTAVANDLRTYGESNGQGEKCVSAIKESYSQLDALRQNADGQRQVDKLFKLCDSITAAPDNADDLADLYSLLTSNFITVAMFNKIGVVGVPRNLTTDTLCEIMLNETIGKEVNRLAAINNLIMENQNVSCLDYKHDTYLADLKNVSLENGNDRQWKYQECTEIVDFQTSSAKPQIFGDKVPLEAFIKECGDVFGPSFNLTSISNGVDKTNELYGGLYINATNVVHVHGSFDPWHVLGLTKTRDKRAPAILVEGAGHAAVLYPPEDNDTPQLKSARKQIDELIDLWLRA